MKLEYIGPKAIITHKEISFKDGKDDKYVYLKDALQILRAIKHEYKKNILYHYDIKDDNISNEDILNEVLGFKNAKEEIKKEIQIYENTLETEIKHLHLHHSNLEKFELDIFKNNLNIMKNYRKQRNINKIIYSFLIEEIVFFIIKYQIKDIDTTFNERFWHILQSIQGTLNAKKLNSQVDTKTINDKLVIFLKINTLFKF